MIRPVLLASLVLAAVPAAAQETRESAAAAKFHREFAQSDKNRDGALSLAEVQVRTAHMRLGASKTGKPDPAVTKRLAQLWFTRADANRDKKVSEPEAQALLAATFARYDANGDGRLGGTERDTAKRALQKGR